MTIALESEIVATRFDPIARTCHYTIERNGHRWTATVPLEHFEKNPHKQARRNHLANVLEVAMRGPPDEPPAMATTEKADV